MFTYRNRVAEGGVAALLARKWKGARVPTVRGAVADEFIKRLEDGPFARAKDAQAWIKKRTKKNLSESGVAPAWQQAKDAA